MKITERQKWVVVAVLAIVLVVMIAHRLRGPAGSARAPAARWAPGEASLTEAEATARPAAAEGRATAGDAPGAPPRAPGAARVTQALEVARTMIRQDPPDDALPRRNLFTPGRGREAPAAGRATGRQTIVTPVADDTEPDPARSLRLEATVRDGARSLAVINGRSVREGDHIGSYVLESVAADHVVLTREGRSFELRLGDRK